MSHPFVVCLCLCVCWCLQLEVVHAGVSKVLCNAEQPDPSPESKMSALLGKQQAAAYLTATAEQTTPTVDSVQEVHLRHLGGISLQQQHLEAHVAAGSKPAVGSGLCDRRLELPSAAQHDGAAAHVLLQPPCRVAYTDGGAPYGSAPQPSSMAVAAAAASGLMRHSLDVNVGSSGMYGAAGTSSSSSGYSGGSPASSNSTEVPSAVAVIETRSSGLLSSGDGSKKVVVLEQQGGGKGVGSIIVSPSGKMAGSGKTVPPAFVQLAHQQNVAGEY